MSGEIKEKLRGNEGKIGRILSKEFRKTLSASGVGLVIFYEEKIGGN